MELCTCKVLNDRKLKVTDRIDRAEMKNGDHTSFYLLRCEVCGGIWGWPEKNFMMALDGGWTLESAESDNNNNLTVAG